jgi:hypothetical protein
MAKKKSGTGKAAGGLARADSLSPARRKLIATQAAAARWAGPIKQATHGSHDHPMKIGDVEIPAYVLADGTRVLSQRGLVSGIGMSTSGGSRAGEPRLAILFDALSAKGTDTKDLAERIKNPIRFRAPGGGRDAYGFEATILADICDVILAGRKAGHLLEQQQHFADRCELLVRGFARVGIIALVDEATGYEKDRVAGSLARILEAFIARELRPWVQTFPSDYYEQLFRLRGLEYSSESVKRPQYFGVLTNDIVYKRLAPGVLAELKKLTERDESGRPKTKYFQRLTANIGYPKLREHLGSIVTLMKLSSDYADFKGKLDTIHPAYGNTMPLPLGYQPEDDAGTGI